MQSFAASAVLETPVSREEPPRPVFCACVPSFRVDKLTGEPLLSLI